VIKECHDGVSWDQWPAELRDRKKRALNRFAREHADRIEYHTFLQYLFFKQWYRLKHYCNERHITIVGDIPIYVSYDSADVWANTGLFKLDSTKKPTGVSGVPPDYFSETGQLWNNPVYNWEALKKSEYGWWRSRMKAMFERFDIVRIDHFRGLVQYWEVPAGEETAMNGTWMDVPTYPFFDTLKKDVPGFPVIAEDLGTITDDVIEAMNHYGFPGMKVLLFAFGADDPAHAYLPHNFERNCIAYTGTHDNNTFKGWFEKEASEEERNRLRMYLGRDGSTDQLCRALIQTLFGSVADVVIVPAQDYLCLDADCRMNQPSQTFGNWQWRLTGEQFNALPFDWIGHISWVYNRKEPATH